MTNTASSSGLLKVLAGLVVTALVLALVGLVVAWLWFQQAISSTGPASPDGADRVVAIERGSGVIRIAETLRAAGAISDVRLFRFAVEYEGAQSDLKAGEFAIPSGASIVDVIEILRDGKSILYPVTIVEGMTSAQAIRAIASSDVLSGGVPDVPPEGTILPDTYLVVRGTDRSELVRRMQAAQDELLDTLWRERASDLPVATKAEAVTLASIVEKETGMADERPMVASVFTNRLRRGIRLQSDPTIIYPITKGEPLGRRIRQSEIDAVNDYNTYQIDGLPIGPICNPGREAIAAVLNPPDSDYLFFVADGTGGHAFARTLREHNNNVRAWYKIRDQRAREGQGG